MISQFQLPAPNFNDRTIIHRIHSEYNHRHNISEVKRVDIADNRMSIEQLRRAHSHISSGNTCQSVLSLNCVHLQTLSGKPSHAYRREEMRTERNRQQRKRGG
jgi:hypothetical protein